MTLITTIISQLGIIHASDSNIVKREDRTVLRGRKVFDLGFDNGAVAVGGVFDFEGEPMDHWLEGFVRLYASKPIPTLEGFAKALKTALGGSPADGPQFFHIAGYVGGSTGSHPRFTSCVHGRHGCARRLYRGPARVRDLRRLLDSR